MYICVPKQSEFHHTLAFLHHHPRRCFLLLFPGINTWYLLAAQLGVDFVPWAMFGILNTGLEDVDPIPAGNQTIMGLYQAMGVRVGGFYVITISQIVPAFQLLYAIGMHIGCSNVIEQTSSSVYSTVSVYTATRSAPCGPLIISQCHSSLDAPRENYLRANADACAGRSRSMTIR